MTKLFISIKYEAIQINVNPYLLLNEKKACYDIYGITWWLFFCKIIYKQRKRKILMSDEVILTFEIWSKFLNLLSHVLCKVQYLPHYFYESLMIYVPMLTFDSCFFLTLVLYLPWSKLSPYFFVLPNHLIIQSTGTVTDVVYCG